MAAINHHHSQTSTHRLIRASERVSPPAHHHEPPTSTTTSPLPAPPRAPYQHHHEPPTSTTTHLKRKAFAARVFVWIAPSYSLQNKVHGSALFHSTPPSGVFCGETLEL
ncbi:hypothetical protein CesoFtcFv8_018014 [Champsocephalus esox]|uniref:Uncharacterized protein n=1 Tax=Champsocephalus esox TaxID=159716 RepID=A0AAN8BLK9_9TELE|nr:hypothetical protein CesoFtcFv8_018014 [Champsocephalus esox]